MQLLVSAVHKLTGKLSGEIKKLIGEIKDLTERKVDYLSLGFSIVSDKV